ncbi:MAG: 2'-5' RNA ligase family protein [Anaeroplasmataceae bacterium]|nr:2'-5' RNA ligase family protein [Anaeroplasmataceae bacterium]
MKQKKFLTVYAVFNEEVQNLLSTWQKDILCCYKGTQTMGIPFHISLGSFPLECEQTLMNLIEETCDTFSPFKVNLQKISTFGNAVLFLEPENHPLIMKLHSIFDGNYADGFTYHAHTTIFCGTEEEVLKAKSILEEKFIPIEAWITEIHLGEFFPTRIILEKKLKCKS